MSRGYYITRLSAPGEPIDPCAPLTFYPPKGSDELHEALKAAYPFESSLSSRMRQAVIDFLMAEQQQDQFMESPLSSSNQLTPEYLPSPQSSFVSTLPSPSVAGYATFNSTSFVDQSAESAPVPAQQDLMNVWTLPSKPDAKIHTRRTMTAEEKKAYKQKRLIGACADCKRRRRKCEHNSDHSMSPPAATSRKVTKRKKSAAAAAPAKPFTAPSVARQLEMSFQAQQNLDLIDFDMSGLSDDMAFDLNAGFKLDTSPEFDLGFDLDIDFPLFPEVPYSSSNMEATMLPAWQGDTSADFSAPVHDNASFQSAFANRPIGHVLDVQDLPLTPQSLETSPMRRTQSGNSDLSSSYVSSGISGDSHSTPASQSSTTPLSRTHSGDSVLGFASYHPSDLTGGTHSASTNQTMSSVSSDMSYSFVDPQALYESVVDLERSDQLHRPTISTSDNGRHARRSGQITKLQDGLFEHDAFSSHILASDEIPNQSRPQAVTSSRGHLLSRQQQQQIPATHIADTMSSSSTTHSALGDTVLPSGVPGRSPHSTATRALTQEDRGRKASGPGYYATTHGSAATQSALEAPTEVQQTASSSRSFVLSQTPSTTTIQDGSDGPENVDPHVPKRNSNLTAATTWNSRGPQSSGSSNGDQDKFLHLLAPAQSTPFSLPAHSQTSTSGSSLGASLLMLACLTQFSASKGASFSRKDAQFVLQHVQDVKLSAVALMSCFIFWGLVFSWTSGSSSSFSREAPLARAGYELAYRLALLVLPATVTVVCFPGQATSLWLALQDTCQLSAASQESTTRQTRQSIQRTSEYTQQLIRRNRSKWTKTTGSLSAVFRRSLCRFPELFEQQGQRVLI